MALTKILLADDDSDDKLIIQDAMESLGAGDIMLYADDGVHALEVLDTNYNLALIPCLIVLDLNMPKLNGTNTLKLLKEDERFKNIPVIIYSTSVNPIEKERCLLLGANAYLTKPLSFNESIDRAKIFLEFCN
ncbi:MAG: response regulator [Chitinophagaceae bacterium]|nr:MAG: response regulator [Chitinophagaceae bacterium]